MAEKAANNGQSIQLSVSPDLEYKYRDLFNLHIGAEDVIIEFGNIHRGQQGQGSIRDRIVLSPANAIRLHQILGQSLTQMQEKLREYNKQHGDKNSSIN